MKYILITLIFCSCGSSPDPQLCGNNQLDEGEYCDGEILLHTCEDFRKRSGIIKCTPDCLDVDLSECEER